MQSPSRSKWIAAESDAVSCKERLNVSAVGYKLCEAYSVQCNCGIEQHIMYYSCALAAAEVLIESSVCSLLRLKHACVN